MRKRFRLLLQVATAPNTVVKARGFPAFDPARDALQAEGVLGGFHRLLESIFERYKS